MGKERRREPQLAPAWDLALSAKGRKFREHLLPPVWHLMY